MSDDKKEKQDRLRKVLHIQELYHGRFNQDEITRLLDHHNWTEGEAISFIQENEATTVRQLLNRLPEDEIASLASDPDIIRSIREGISTTTRLFACSDCDRSWWRKVPSRKEVSECHRCHSKYDPVPREREWGWAIFNCECGNEFSGFGQMYVTKSDCRECGQYVYPSEIRPPSRRNRTKRSRMRHNCDAPDCHGYGEDGDIHDLAGTINSMTIYSSGGSDSSPNIDRPPGGYTRGGQGRGRGRGGAVMKVCVSPESRRGKSQVIFASQKHRSTGSTVATFLEQDDLCSLDSYVSTLPIIRE